MNAAAEKKIIIIAGPNGAGKTTFANAFLPNEANCPHFANADLIAAGLAPFAPETVAFRAGRLMTQEIQGHVRRGRSLALETTLSGRHYARLIPQWQAAGYRVKLIFLKLDSPELAMARVRQRVRNGGHHIPEPVIVRRFAAGLRNLHALYKPLADEWAVYDNSGQGPLLLGEGVRMTDFTTNTGTRPRTPDQTNAEIALKRAARQALENARKVGVPVVTLKNGKIVEAPEPAAANPDR